VRVKANLEAESSMSVIIEVRVWIILRIGTSVLIEVSREDESGSMWRSTKAIVSVPLASTKTVS
jgi:hypothetical protein